jgi:hypothetical protein
MSGFASINIRSLSARYTFRAPFQWKTIELMEIVEIMESMEML